MIQDNKPILKLSTLTIGAMSQKLLVGGLNNPLISLPCMYCDKFRIFSKALKQTVQEEDFSADLALNNITDYENFWFCEKLYEQGKMCIICYSVLCDKGCYNEHEKVQLTELGNTIKMKGSCAST